MNRIGSICSILMVVIHFVWAKMEENVITEGNNGGRDGEVKVKVKSRTGGKGERGEEEGGGARSPQPIRSHDLRRAIVSERKTMFSAQFCVVLSY